MKDINREKLWAYLEKRFNELGDEYDRQMENAKAAKDDENIKRDITAKLKAITQVNKIGPKSGLFLIFSFIIIFYV